MHGFFKPAASVFAALTVIIVSSAPAAAHDRWRHKHRHHYQPPIVKHADPGELLAAGIVGLAIGAIIAGAANQHNHNHAGVHHPTRPRPDRNYFPPEPDDYSDEPTVIYAEPAYEPPQPWSPEWYRYCRNRFRSFDDDSGTYLGYDGRRHFCIAK